MFTYKLVLHSYFRMGNEVHDVPSYNIQYDEANHAVCEWVSAWVRKCNILTLNYTITLRNEAAHDNQCI